MLKPNASPKSQSDSRGRNARKPSELPMRGWKDVLIRTRREAKRDHVGLIAAGVTFYALMAIFPAIVSFVSIYGLMAHPASAAEDFARLQTMLPSPVRGFIGDQMMRLATAETGALSGAVLFGLLVSLWSANGAAKAMIVGLNIAYEEDEKRGFVRLNLTALGFTLGVATVAASVSWLVVATATDEKPASGVASLLAWPAQWIVIALALALLYRFGPSRNQPRWRWVSWGSAAGSTLLLLATAGLAFYFANFTKLDATYGSLGAVIAFLTWVYWSAFLVLLGGELNAELEHQTAIDSTAGRPAPLGSRGAVMADTVGEATNRGSAR